MFFPLSLYPFLYILIKKGGGNWPCEALATTSSFIWKRCQIRSRLRRDKISQCSYMYTATVVIQGILTEHRVPFFVRCLERFKWAYAIQVNDTSINQKQHQLLLYCNYGWLILLIPALAGFHRSKQKLCQRFSIAALLQLYNNKYRIALLKKRYNCLWQHIPVQLPFLPVLVMKTR